MGTKEMVKPASEQDFERIDKELAFAISFYHHQTSVGAPQAGFDSTAIIPKEERMRLIREAAGASKDDEGFMGVLASKVAERLIDKGHHLIAAGLWIDNAARAIADKHGYGIDRSELIGAWFRMRLDREMPPGGAVDAEKMKRALTSLEVTSWRLRDFPPGERIWDVLGPARSAGGDVRRETITRLDDYLRSPPEIIEWINEPKKPEEIGSRLERYLSLKRGMPEEIGSLISDWIETPLKTLTPFSQSEVRASVIGRTLERMETVVRIHSRISADPALATSKEALEAGMYIHFLSADRSIAAKIVDNTDSIDSEQVKRWVMMPFERFASEPDPAKINISSVIGAMRESSRRRGLIPWSRGPVRQDIIEWAGAPLAGKEKDAGAIREHEDRMEYIMRMDQSQGQDDPRLQRIINGPDYKGKARRYGFNENGTINIVEFTLAYEIWNRRMGELRGQIGEEEASKRGIRPPNIYVAEPKPLTPKERQAMFGRAGGDIWLGMCVGSSYIVLNSTKINWNRQEMTELIEHEMGHYLQGNMNPDKVMITRNGSPAILLTADTLELASVSRSAPAKLIGRWVDEGGNEFSTVADITKPMAYGDAPIVMAMMGRIYASHTLGLRDHADMNREGARIIRSIRQSPGIQDWTPIQQAVDAYFSEPGLFEKVITARSGAEGKQILVAANSRRIARERAKERRSARSPRS